MPHQSGHSGEDVGPEGAAAARFTGATWGLTSRKRWTEGGATTPENPALQCTERGPRASSKKDGKCCVVLSLQTMFFIM